MLDGARDLSVASIQIGADKTWRGALHENWCVLHALMLRDIKTRFFGSGLGYLMYVGWPLSHILIVVLMFSFGGRLTPYGDNIYLYIATGTAPFMCFSYSSRFIMLAYAQNRPLLSFPVVKFLDVIIARSILEGLTAALIIIILIAIFIVSGIDCMPLDVAEAFYALAASISLGVGVGMINSVIAAAMPFYMTLYMLIIIILWAASGVVFVPDYLPEFIRVPLSYNPILHGVIWLRSAYYPGYGTLTLDKTYLIAWAIGCVCAGLVLERLVRGRLLQG